MALRLGKRMGLPVYHSDSVFNMLRDAYDLPVSPERLCDPVEVAKLNLSWGDNKDITSAKGPFYVKLIGDIPGDFIIEGFSLSFPEDRQLVFDAVGPHRPVILRIDLPFNKWCDFYQGKWGKEGHHLRQSYERLRSYFSAQPNETVYTFQDPNMIDVHYAPYQTKDFIDSKIKALKIPLRVGDVVNDIGCNEGVIGAWCLNQGAKRVRGYDRNWRFLDKAAFNGLEVHLGNVETDELEIADITLCVSVFHYFKDPEGVIAKLRAHTRRTLVLELPIYQQPGLVSRFIPENRMTWYSKSLIEFWLKENFSDITVVGESVPPDNSYRLVFHCTV